MTSRTHRSLSPVILAVAFNGVVAASCVVLAASAPTRAGSLLAAAGLVFFGLATVGFALMLATAMRRRPAGARSSKSDDPATEGRAR